MKIKIMGYSLWFFDTGYFSVTKDHNGKTHVVVDLSREEKRELIEKLKESLDE